MYVECPEQSLQSVARYLDFIIEFFNVSMHLLFLISKFSYEKSLLKVLGVLPHVREITLAGQVLWTFLDVRIYD